MNTARFYDWVKEVDLDIHPEFRRALSRRFFTEPCDQHLPQKNYSLREGRTDAENDRGHEQLSNIDYDPSAQKNDAVKEGIVRRPGWTWNRARS